MKFSISLFSFCILSFILVLSCSTEEVQDTTPPPSIIQTPQPETPAPIQYTLSVSSGDGGTVSSEGGTYDEGTDITLTATPNGEYIFSNWSNGSTDNPISFELNSDTNLTANFEKRKYALTINISGEGTVTEEIIETDKSTDYDSGTKVKLTAVPSEGWVFRSWGELIENQELSFEIIIDEPKEVNVVFDEIVEEGYFSVNYEGNGTFIRYGAPYPPLKSYGVELIEGEVNDDGEYLNGSTLRFTYQNNPGWRMMMEYKKELYNGVPKMSIINDFEENVWSNILNGNNFIIDENMTIPINVWTTGYTNNDNFPIDPPKISKKVLTTKSILEKKVDSKYILSKKILKTILKDGTGGYYSKSEIDLEIARPLTRTMVKMHRAHQDNYYSNKFINDEKKLNWIRKLTPLEALRLQGFPDQFYHKAKKNNISDTQLYMQAGNSVTVNVVEAILDHLIKHNWFK